MAQESGSRFKLVFSHWYEYKGERFPISNGLHPAYVKWFQRLQDDTLCRRHLRTLAIDSTFQQPDSGYLFRHGNFTWHFCKEHSEKNLITEDQVIDDGSVYYFPIDVEWSGMHLLAHPRQFFVDGVRYDYYFKDSLTPRMIEFLKSGKVKLLVTNLIDASAIKGQVEDLERVVNSIGIHGSNVVLAQGNRLNFAFEKNPSCQIKMLSGIISLYQAADLFRRYPFYSADLNYLSDIMLPADLDSTKLRGKKFICFNRSMNRAHRLATAYLAMKYNLLKDGIFSFVTNLNDEQHMANDFAKLYPEEDIPAVVKKIKELVPYEIDTQHFTDSQKQSFQTIGINKKDLYEDTYVHIVSESSFDESLDPFFSEKTWRPILNLQPFLFIGNCNSLAKLKQLGFKTFHPYIDESYDSEQDPKKRFLMIEEEIKKLSNKSIQELHDWYYSITDILIYNQNHLRTFKDYDPYEELYK